MLPGFGLSLGYTVFYLSLVIVVPLATIFAKSATVSWRDFIALMTSEGVVSAFKVSFGIAFAAALTNALFGLILAWVLVRYRFVGRRLLDGAIDLPFALPTAVAGLALAEVYSQNGWLGRSLVPHHIIVYNTMLGIYVALVFIGLPFVVRTVQPVLEDVDVQVEEAAASLGASRYQTIARVIAPAILPALLTGFALAFARALGEYGSIQFICPGIPGRTEIVPTRLYALIGNYELGKASAIAVVMLVCSFVIFFGINILQRWTARNL